MISRTEAGWSSAAAQAFSKPPQANSILMISPHTASKDACKAQSKRGQHASIALKCSSAVWSRLLIMHYPGLQKMRNDKIAHEDTARATPECKGKSSGLSRSFQTRNFL
jgi:hypothetical protein